MYSVYVITHCPACKAKKGRSGKLTAYQLEQLNAAPPLAGTVSDRPVHFIKLAQCASCHEWGLNFEIKRARLMTETPKKPRKIAKEWLLNPPNDGLNAAAVVTDEVR